MAKISARLDFNELEKLKSQLEKIGNTKQRDQFLNSCTKELAARLLAKVIKRTPVGQYPSGSGKTGGTLRRGWTAGQQNSNANAYVNSLNVDKVGNKYIIEITNPVEYASYVEFGHRTRNHKGWVDGKFMLTISEDEVRKSAPTILQKKLDAYLRGCFK